MNKKDHQLIAHILANTGTNGVDELLLWGKICENLAHELKNQNPNFSVISFLDSCGFDMAFGKQWRQTV